jgi:phage tail sheath gpL-like
MHNAWLYYLEARSLASPLPLMSTAATDKLYDESQKVLPADLPAGDKTATLSTGTATYKLTALFPEAVGNDLDLIVKYQGADISNTAQAYQSNVAVMKTLLKKYPELRDAFAAVVARAVDPAGHDYGTLLAMKDIK